MSAISSHMCKAELSRFDLHVAAYYSTSHCVVLSVVVDYDHICGGEFVIVSSVVC